MSEGLPAATQRITQSLIDSYAELSGDHNPIHVDPEAAARSEFGSTIAHGPIALQSFLVALTTLLESETLPPGSRVSIRYRRPLRPGDEVSSRMLEWDENSLAAECVNGEGEAVALVSAEIPGIGRRIEAPSS